MAKVPYSVEKLPKISIVWVGRTNVTDRQTTDRRQTDGRRHIANMNLSSRSLIKISDYYTDILSRRPTVSKLLQIIVQILDETFM